MVGLLAQLVPSDAFWSVVSYSLGTASVLIWLCAQMPQVVKNWRRKSVDGLSIGFLVAWVAGDTSNLLGCLLTGQLGVQVLLASYYCAMDVVLGVQYFIYRERTAEVLDGFDPLHSGLLPYDPDACDNTNRRPSNKSRRASSLGRTRDRIAALLSVSTLVNSAGRASALPIVSGDSPTAPPHAAVDFGFFVAYFSMVMYLGSRWPQIWHNFERKSTTGVSMLLFTSAFMGNLTYTLSILLSPQSVGQHAHRREFLVKELPYIIGAAGTMLFDCVILGQWYYYHRMMTPHRRRSTAALDRISRPYLGTPLPTPDPFRLDAPMAVPSSRLALGDAHRGKRSRRPDKTPLVLSHQSVYGGTTGGDPRYF